MGVRRNLDTLFTSSVVHEMSAPFLSAIVVQSHPTGAAETPSTGTTLSSQGRGLDGVERRSTSAGHCMSALPTFPCSSRGTLYPCDAFASGRCSAS